ERKRPKRVSTIAGPAACHLATKAARPASGVRRGSGTGSEVVCALASATSLPKAASEASVPATALVPLRNVRRPNAVPSRVFIVVLQSPPPPRRSRRDRDAVVARPPQEQGRGALGKRRHGERGVHAERGRHRGGVGHEDAGVAAQLVPVVEG